MYQPAHFTMTDSEQLHALMRAYPFATLVVQSADGLAANHLPVEWVEGKLHGHHVARGNELASMHGADVLVIFRGPDGYISPNWYPTKQQTHREVPTWNYAVVHVHGRLRVIEDPSWLRTLLERLTNRHEADQPAPWHVSDAPEDHIEKMLRAIVGLEISMDRIEGKFKLNQNHPTGNCAGVIEGLHRRGRHGDADLAQLMSQNEEGRS